MNSSDRLIDARAAILRRVEVERARGNPNEVARLYAVLDVTEPTGDSFSDPVKLGKLFRALAE